MQRNFINIDKTTATLVVSAIAVLVGVIGLIYKFFLRRRKVKFSLGIGHTSYVNTNQPTLTWSMTNVGNRDLTIVEYGGECCGENVGLPFSGKLQARNARVLRPGEKVDEYLPSLPNAAVKSFYVRDAFGKTYGAPASLIADACKKYRDATKGQR
jgi:hypothetical protein